MMDILKKLLYYFNSIFDLVSFGFWPSLVLTSFFLIIGNALYFAVFLVVNGNKNPKKRKRDYKLFWWALLGQMVFAAIGLSAIYIDKGVSLGSIYVIFVMYYLLATFFIFLSVLGLIDWHKERRNKHH